MLPELCCVLCVCVCVLEAKRLTLSKIQWENILTHFSSFNVRVSVCVVCGMNSVLLLIQTEYRAY